MFAHMSIVSLERSNLCFSTSSGVKWTELWVIGNMPRGKPTITGRNDVFEAIGGLLVKYACFHSPCATDHDTYATRKCMYGLLGVE
jgi:hypothetical protein